ncbi:hypothetical protein CsatB_022938 [Cannabis sativa]
MAKKRRTVRKPVARGLDPEPIDDADDGETEKTTVVEQGNSNWAKEVEDEIADETDQTHFQESARSHWKSFKEEKLIYRDPKLKFTEPIIKNGIKIAQLDLEEVKEEAASWNSTMICMVLGANPPMAVFEGFIKRIWGHLGIKQIVKMTRGLVMINFNDEALRDQVLEAVVFQFDMKPVIVRPWTSDLNAVKLVRSVPLWIRLHDLGLQYWGTNCLSALVSTVGKPIMVDQHTKDRIRVQFARVLVEMDITDTPPRTIQYVNEYGQIVDQNIDYEWLPVKCKSCMGYGHIMANCRKGEMKKKQQELKGRDSAQSSVQEQETKERTKQVEATATRKLVLQEEIGTRAQNKDWVTPRKTFSQKHPKEAEKKGDTWGNSVNSFMALGGDEGGQIMDKVSEEEGEPEETKLRGEKVKEMMENKFNNWDYFSSSTIEGRILVLWRRTFVKVIVIAETSQFVHCYVKVSGTDQACYITFVYDRIGGNPPCLNDLVDSQAWFAQAHVEALKRTGSDFTWTNNQDGISRIYSKIDHVFANEDWHDTFGNNSAHYGWETTSDHCSCVVSIKAHMKIGVKPFRFYNFWADHPKFKELVLQNWEKPLAASGMKGVYLKLMRLKHVLKKFNHETIGDIGKSFHQAKDRYQEARLKAQAHAGDSDYQDQERVAAANFISCDKMKSENRIASFTNDHGDIIDNFSEVVDHFMNHFNGFMGTRNDTAASLNMECFELNSRLNLDQQILLLKPFSNNEIKKAMFSIPDSKSPGPDGFNSGFFKVMWADIGKEVCKAISDFFITGYMPAKLHSSMISLIPKNDNPTKAVDFRPIACCSTLYKCVSKLLCSRLAKDLLKNYNRKNISPQCAIKIDISKAYDTVNWEFLDCLLPAFNLPQRFIKWLMTCITSTSYSIIMNGRIQGKFKREKGLRQALRYVLEEFTKASGLHINHYKSQIFLGGVSPLNKQSIIDELKLVEGKFRMKYLGIPLRPTKWKAEDCSIIIKKITQRLHNWASKHLSFAGKIQLIHSVLIGLRNYWMSIFVLPQSVTKEIERLCRGFLWGVNGNRSKVHVASWDKVCLPKAYGGLGFKDGAKWNHVNLAKFVWAISNKKDLLWVKWINTIYLKQESYWLYELKPDTSWYWRKLCHLRKRFTEGDIKAAVRTCKLRTSLLYNSLLDQNLFQCHKTIWSSLNLPKRRFILWQVVNSYLLTKDNMARFHIPVESNKCPVCEDHFETHEHLFFSCCLSRKMIELVFEWLGTHMWPLDFQSWIGWLSLNMDNKVRKISIAAAAATCYYLWINRNRCVFEGYSHNDTRIVADIKSIVRYRVQHVNNRRLNRVESRFLQIIQCN